MRQGLNERYGRAGRAVEGGELDANGATADDDHALGQVAERNRVVARQQLGRRRIEARPQRRPRTGGDDKAIRGDVFQAVGRADRKLTRRLEAAHPGDDLDTGILQEQAHATSEALHNAVLPFLHPGPIKGCGWHVDAKVSRVTHGLQDLNAPEERLGGYTTPVQADPADGAFLYEHNLGAKLRGAQRGHIAARACSHDCHITPYGQTGPPAVAVITSPVTRTWRGIARMPSRGQHRYH